jgi:hypothetical protein
MDENNAEDAGDTAGREAKAIALNYSGCGKAGSGGSSVSGESLF